jgi:hypothetical protein
MNEIRDYLHAVKLELETEVAKIDVKLNPVPLSYATIEVGRQRLLLRGIGDELAKRLVQTAEHFKDINRSEELIVQLLRRMTEAPDHTKEAMMTAYVFLVDKQRERRESAIGTASELIKALSAAHK